MQNKISDLNNILFESIERLNDDELTDEELDKEIKKSEAIQKVCCSNIDVVSLNSVQFRENPSFQRCINMFEIRYSMAAQLHFYA